MSLDQREYDLITFGDMCVDLIVSGDDVAPVFGQVEKLVDDYAVELGGSCCIFACQAARLGLRTAILGRVGDDGFGQVVLQKLAAAGVDTGHVVVDRSLKTGLSIALTQNGDRAILTYLGSICALSPEDAADATLVRARHLHHGSFFLHTGLRPHMPQIFERAHALGLTTSLDTNWDPDDRWNSTLADTLARTDVCLPNEQEALRMAGASSLDGAVAWLRARSTLVALKRGADGATLYGPDVLLDQPALPLAAPGDSIGAGDSFDAGFLAGWLRGMPLEVCLQIASFCGSSVAGAVGGLQGQPTWEQVERFLVRAKSLDLP